MSPNYFKSVSKQNRAMNTEFNATYKYIQEEQFKNNPLMWRMFLFGLSAILLLIPESLLYAQNSSELSKPNIILIMVDDLGYGELGSYGQEIIQTPFLDTMAKEGMRFTDYYSGSTVCAPSRESLMTGMHTGNTYLKGNFNVPSEGDFPIPFSRKTIAQYLKPAGYRTALIGKWGLGGAGSGSGPNSRGFNYSLAYLSQLNAHSYYPPFLWENEEKNHLEGNMNGQSTTYSHTFFVNKTLEYIENSDNEQPFFLYLPYTIPHGRFEIPDDAPYSNEDWGQTQKNIAAMVTLLDRDVGRILELLREKEMAENTVVFFTSDNGPTSTANPFFNSNGPLRGIKRDLYEGGIRVPMIAWWPGTIEPGQRSSHISAAWDFLPTIVDIAGLEPPSDVDGISFLPELLGEEQPEHEFLYWEFYDYNWNWEQNNNNLPRNWLESQAVRYGKWKAVIPEIFSNQNTETELYDLENDIGETTNVAQDHPKIVQKLEAYMIRAYKTNPHFPYRP